MRYVLLALLVAGCTTSQPPRRVGFDPRCRNEFPNMRSEGCPRAPDYYAGRLTTQ